MSRVLTAGETMALLDPVEEGELQLGDRLTLRFAGAESNFAVGLARLGVPVTWVSRLGADRTGRLILDALAREGVDVRWVRSDPDAPTGVYFKWREGGRTAVEYVRRGSAASRLQPEDVPDEALGGVELVHLTGITMALGEGARALVVDVARRARERGATVVFDPNYRPPLWESPAAAAAAMEPVLEHVDWYLCGTAEQDALGAVETPGLVVRTHEGSLVSWSGRAARVTLARSETVVDEVGAGDAFAAGFVYGLLDGRPPSEAVELAHTVAARALRGTGDWETLPRRDELP